MTIQRDQLSRIFGPENVSEDEALIASYSRDESVVHPIKPRYVCQARSAAQVQALVALANQELTPLVPVSSGPPHFRGDTVPSVPGAVIVDLSGMKKIMHIDVRNRMALIEPGVTYPQLQPELARAGLKLSMPLMPRPNKSVLASLLEREPRIIPRYQWAALEPLRCLEVIWGDGNRMATGDTAGTEALENEWKNGFAQISGNGPVQTDFFKFTSAAQGSMGIATWASVKCEVLPQVQRLFLVPSDRLDNLIDYCYAILRIRFADELFILNRWSLANLLGDSPARIGEIAYRSPPWVMLVGISGRDRLPEERVQFQQKDLDELATKHGLRLQSELHVASGQQVLAKISQPSHETCWKLKNSDGCLELFFLSTLESAPRFAQAMQAQAETQHYPADQIGAYIQPVHQGASCHIEFNLPYQKNQAAGVTAVQNLFQSASQEMLKQGAYFSRPYGPWARMAFNRDFQTTQVLTKIKGIFDPHNVMNPGKLCF